MTELLLDAAGRRRSPATMPGSTPAARRATKDTAIRPIRPTVEEIVAVALTTTPVTDAGCAV
jgi:hypothetical protein